MNIGRPNYRSSGAPVQSIFDDKSKFTRLNSDLTSTRLNTLHNYLLTLRKRNEISESEFKFDTTTTPHYNVGKFLSSLLNPLTINDYNLRDSFHAISEIKTIPHSLFDQDYRFVSFDIASLFTNVPLKRTIEIILKRVFEDKLINTTLTKRTLKKLLLDCATKTAFRLTTFSMSKSTVFLWVLV